MVRRRIPGAEISFAPDPSLQSAFDRSLPIDDSNAEREWNWKPTYDHEQIVDDFLQELRLHPQRYI
jgi:hypothetical protein